ncbi:trithorax group protein osa [Carica papaya]|uniref:trithorax group protein osa n=1 Tax=Carica papaya TaxID=3649 RepID=UPI000B8C7AAE|nr:trithorax group protein osa [Carica papaya]
MASGSSGRANSGSKGFDFGSDDILCSYEDYGSNQDSSNGPHSDPVISAASSGKDFHKSRMVRTSVFPANAYTPPEDTVNQDVISTVEKTMKKYADNLMRFLEGISSRLSQLELYCYNLDKSIGEMRSDLVRDHGEADTKLKFLEKHLQEVHRSVQILRDKQELADAQKELAKLQLAQKESSSLSNSQSSEERTTTLAIESKKNDNAPDMHNQQLALALPHQVAPQQHTLPPNSQSPPQNLTQQQSYYIPPTQLQNPQAPAPPPPALAPPPAPAPAPNPTPAPPAAPIQHPQGQYLSSDPQYRTTQLQDLSRLPPQVSQSQVNQGTAAQSFPQYLQQWPQQIPQHMQQQQQPSMQTQIRPTSATYSYRPTQPSSQSPPEAIPNSMPMQVPFSGIPQPASSCVDAVAYGYNVPGRTVPPQPAPQQIKSTFGAQPGDGYTVTGPHPALPQGSTYMMYDNEGGRILHTPQPQAHFSQGGYPPTSVPLQNQQLPPGAGILARNPSHVQFVRNHPYGELIDKLVSMGFRGDHVAAVIQRMEESGQPIDFNTVLDRLNALDRLNPHASALSQRGW